MFKNKLFNRKKSNWDKLKSQTPEEKYRDVYEDQQFDRSEVGEKKSPLLRIIGSILLSLLVGFLVFTVLNLIMMGVAGFNARMNHMPKGGIMTPGKEYVAVGKSEDTGKFYYVLPEDGPLENPEDVVPEDERYASVDDVPEPDWYIKKKTEKIGLLMPLDRKGEARVWIGSIISSLVMFGFMYAKFMKNLQAQNIMNDVSDINQYVGDQHIALPEEIQRQFDYFPDAGAHSNVVFYSMISHMALSNKGLKRIEVVKRHEKDVLDRDGEILAYEGEPVLDRNGEIIYETKPLIDTKFADAVFEASGAAKSYWKKWDTRAIEYNPDGKDREKLGKFNTVTDLINEDWTFPDYEVQRPGGVYLVDTAPVNTMVLAITRGGKGQTVIEPTLDMWTRQKKADNLIVNDSKGELLVKFYVAATMRGYEVIQFNLILPDKTNIYNPLAMAAQSAREGVFAKSAAYVENIAEIFFPISGGDDPFWRATRKNTMICPMLKVA